MSSEPISIVSGLTGMLSGSDRSKHIIDNPHVHLTNCSLSRDSDFRHFYNSGWGSVRSRMGEDIPDMERSEGTTCVDHAHIVFTAGWWVAS